MRRSFTALLCSWIAAGGFRPKPIYDRARYTPLHGQSKHCYRCDADVFPRLAQQRCTVDECPFRHMPLYEHPVPVACPRCNDQTYCGIFPELRDDDGAQIAPERLLCKWCGYCYAHEYGLIQAEPNRDRGYWDLRSGEPQYLTPQELAGGVQLREDVVGKI